MKIFAVAVLVLAKHVPTVFGFYGLCVNKATFMTNQRAEIFLRFSRRRQTQLLAADVAMGVVNE